MAVTTHTATTGSGGAFSDTIPGEGKFTAVATAVLTTPGGTELIVTSNTVKIAANYDVSIAFVDDGNGTISGALLGDEGTTVAGVVVTLTIVDGDGNTTTATVTTDSSGNFSYTLTEPGDYTITATATVTTALGTKGIASDELDAELVLPDEGAITCAASASGETATISGALTASSWLSVANRTVILTITDSAGTSTTATATTDSSGNYSVDWDGDNGTYSVVASCVVSDSLTVTADAAEFTIVDTSISVDAGDHAGDIIYETDFSDWDSITDLTTLAGSYDGSSNSTVSSGTVAIEEDGLAILNATSNLFPKAYLPDTSVTNFVATLTLTLNANAASETLADSGNAQAGLVFWSASKNRISVSALCGLTYAYINNIQSTTTYSTTSAALANSMSSGVEFYIRVECTGGVVKLYVNGDLAITRTITTPLTGYLGLAHRQNQSTSSARQKTVFKKLKVYEYVD